MNKQYNKRASSHTGHLEVDTTCCVIHLVCRVSPATIVPRILETYTEQKRWPHIVTVGREPTVGDALHIIHCRERGVEAVTTGGTLTPTSLWIVVGGSKKPSDACWISFLVSELVS